MHMSLEAPQHWQLHAPSMHLKLNEKNNNKIKNKVTQSQKYSAQTATLAEPTNPLTTISHTLYSLSHVKNTVVFGDKTAI